jgi:hypothetical protein
MFVLSGKDTVAGKLGTEENEGTLDYGHGSLLVRRNQGALEFSQVPDGTVDEILPNARQAASCERTPIAARLKGLEP